MSPARIALFTLLSGLVLYGVNAYAHRRLRAGFGLGPRGSRRLAWLLSGTVLLAMVSSLLDRLGATENPGLLRLLHGPTWTLELVLVLALPLLVLQHLAEVLLRRLPRSRPVEPPSAPRPPPPLPTERAREAAALASPQLPGLEPVLEGVSPRRQFLLQALSTGTLTLTGGASAYGALVERKDYALETRELPIPGLPAGLEGFTLVQLSDIHVGAYTGREELEAALDLARDARADLAVLTGDLIDHDARLVPRLQGFLRTLRTATRQGVAAIPGNHDYYAGVDAVLEGCRQAGADVLLNEHRLVGASGSGSSAKLALLGVDDVFGKHSGRGPDLARATAGLDPTLPRILLCHNPSFFAEAAGKVALQLSGHTHGGQVNPLFRPADHVLPQGWVEGRYDLQGSVLYVNRGFGTVGPPARLGARPEVTRIVLVRA